MLNFMHNSTYILELFEKGNHYTYICAIEASEKNRKRDNTYGNNMAVYGNQLIN
jgi:hypothetical protein